MKCLTETLALLLWFVFVFVVFGISILNIYVIDRYPKAVWSGRQTDMWTICVWTTYLQRGKQTQHFVDWCVLQHNVWLWRYWIRILRTEHEVYLSFTELQKDHWPVASRRERRHSGGRWRGRPRTDRGYSPPLGSGGWPGLLDLRKQWWNDGGHIYGQLLKKYLYSISWDHWQYWKTLGKKAFKWRQTEVWV